jgi:hypothetical protein
MVKCPFVFALAGVLLLAGCARDEGYPTQAEGGVRNLGDAIQHCRRYTHFHVSGDPVISLDALSTRRESRYYEVFLNLDTKKDNGWAHCRITMAGDIRVHRVHGFNSGQSLFGF